MRVVGDLSVPRRSAPHSGFGGFFPCLSRSMLSLMPFRRDRQHRQRVPRHQQRRPDLVRHAQRGNRVDQARHPGGSPRRFVPRRHLADVALDQLQLPGDPFPFAEPHEAVPLVHQGFEVLRHLEAFSRVGVWVRRRLHLFLCDLRGVVECVRFGSGCESAGLPLGRGRVISADAAFAVFTGRGVLRRPLHEGDLRLIRVWGLGVRGG